MPHKVCFSLDSGEHTLSEIGPVLRESLFTWLLPSAFPIYTILLVSRARLLPSLLAIGHCYLDVGPHSHFCILFFSKSSSLSSVPDLEQMAPPCRMHTHTLFTRISLLLLAFATLTQSAPHPEALLIDEPESEPLLHERDTPTPVNKIPADDILSNQHVTATKTHYLPFLTDPPDYVNVGDIVIPSPADGARVAAATLDVRTYRKNRLNTGIKVYYRIIKDAKGDYVGYQVINTPVPDPETRFASLAADSLLAGVPTGLRSIVDVENVIPAGGTQCGAKECVIIFPVSIFNSCSPLLRALRYISDNHLERRRLFRRAKTNQYSLSEGSQTSTKANQEARDQELVGTIQSPSPSPSLHLITNSQNFPFHIKHNQKPH